MHHRELGRTWIRWPRRAFAVTPRGAGWFLTPVVSSNWWAGRRAIRCITGGAGWDLAQQRAARARACSGSACACVQRGGLVRRACSGAGSGMAELSICRLSQTRVVSICSRRASETASGVRSPELEARCVGEGGEGDGEGDGDRIQGGGARGNTIICASGSSQARRIEQQRSTSRRVGRRHPLAAPMIPDVPRTSATSRARVPATLGIRRPLRSIRSSAFRRSSGLLLLRAPHGGGGENRATNARGGRPAPHALRLLGGQHLPKNIHTRKFGRSSGQRS